MMIIKLLLKVLPISLSLKMWKPAFKAYGWQVLRVADSEDIEAMEAAVKEASGRYRASQSDHCAYSYRLWQPETGQCFLPWRAFGC